MPKAKKPSGVTPGSKSGRRRAGARVAFAGAVVLALLAGSYAAFGYVQTPGHGVGIAQLGTLAGPVDHFVLTPGSGTETAGAPFSVTVAAEDHSGRVVAGYTGTITFSSSDSRAVFPGGGSYTFRTADAGTHAFTAPGVTLETAGSGETVAVADGSATGQASFTVDPGAASAIVLAGATSDLASGAGRAFTATVEDAAGNTITSGSDSTVSVTFANPGSGPGSLTGLGAVPAVAGVASETVTGKLSGAVSLQATATLSGPGATSSSTLGFNVVNGAATQIVISGSTTDLVAGATRAVTATIEDAAGNAVSAGPDCNDVITFTQSGGTGTVTGLTAPTASGGVATDLVTVALAGTVRLKANATLGAGAVTSSALVFNVTVGPAAAIDLSGSLQDLASASTRTYTATVEDAGGNTITTGLDSTVSLTFAKTNPTGTGTVSGLATVTAVAGVATDNVTGLVAGAMKIEASATLSGPGAVSSNGRSFNVVAGPATQIAMTGGGTANLTSGAMRTFTATIEDAAGNTVTSGSDSSAGVSFGQTGTGTVTGLATVPAVAGVAADTVTGGLAGPVSVQAATTLSSGAATSNAKAFTVVFGAAAQIVLSGSTADLVSGSASTYTATIEDAAGNTITGGTDQNPNVVFALTGAGPGTVTGLGSVNAANGVASKTVTGVLAGPLSLHATATLSGPGSTSSSPLSFNVLPGAATQLLISGSTSDLASGATGNLTATVADAAGNTVPSGPDSSVTVTFVKTGNGAGTVSGLAATPATGGVATDTVTGVLAGAIKLNATATLTGPGSVVSGNLAFNVVAGPATKIALTGSTGDLASGTARTFTATIEDAAGNTVTSGPDSTVEVAFTKNSGSGSVSGVPATVTAVAGVSTDSVTGVLVGTTTLRATATLSGPGTVFDNRGPFSIVLGPASQIVLTGGTNNLTSGSETRTFTATIEDAAGNIVATGADAAAAVAFSQTGTGTLGGLATVPAVAGVATDTITGALVGSVNVQAGATLNSIPVISNVKTFTVVVGAAAKIVLSGSSADLAAGTTSTYTATIEDAAGNTVVNGADSTTSVTFAKIGGSGTVTGLGSPNAANGVASKTVTGMLAGPVTLQATATLSGPGSTSSTTLGFNVVVGAATQILISGSISDLVSAATRSVTATVADAGGNTVATGSDSTVSVTFAKTASSTGTVSGLAAVPAVAGVASDTVTGLLAGVLKLNATATLSGPGAVTSANLVFNVVAGPATKVNLTGSLADLASGTARLFTATIQDAAGNTVITGADSTAAVSFTKIGAGTGTVSGLLASVPAVAGVATDSVTGVLAGVVTNLRAGVTLTGPGAVMSNRGPFNVVAGPIAQLKFTTSPGGTLAHAAPFGTQPVVQAQDASGNAVLTFAGTVSLSIASGPGGANLAGCTAPAPVNGVTTFSGCMIDLAGAYTLGASDGSGHTGVSASFTVT